MRRLLAVLAVPMLVLACEPRADPSAPMGPPNLPPPQPTIPQVTPPQASATATGCPATFAAASAAHPVCGPASQTCDYAEGSCACVLGCMGGAPPPPNFKPASSWECTPKACSQPHPAGAACAPEGAHCGRCFGEMADCKGGKWAVTTVPPPP